MTALGMFAIVLMAVIALSSGNPPGPTWVPA